MKKYTDVDIIAELQKLVDSHVDSYKEDFDIDKRIILRAAESQNPEDRTLMWFCRPHGTHCLNENQVFIQGTRDHNTFRFYAEQTYDECVARVIVPKAVKRGKVFGDVFLSKDGETFKELKAADYIPVGATLNVNGIKCRIDAVDFAADEVRLTNIEDKNRPIRFSESIQYVRAYVEDAGTAIYDTIPKKPAARESIRDKLKSAQKGQPPHTPKPQKSKRKDMEL